MEHKTVKGIILIVCLILYYGDVNASANMTYNTYTTGLCHGRVGWEDYPVWGN